MSDLDLVIAIARRAGGLARSHLGRVERLTKRGAEAVTIADREVQRLIAGELAAAFPDDGLIGEENDDGSAITFLSPRRGARVWVVDPIDGTNNFVAGYPGFAVCIGLLDHGLPVLGVVYDVVRDETYAAARGAGAWFADQRGWEARRALRVRQEPVEPSSLLMLTSNLRLPDGQADGQSHGQADWAIDWITDSPWKIRMIGSAALECVQVALGTALAAVTLNGKLWDVVAPAAVVLEAGGRVVTPTGSDRFPMELTGYSGGKLPFFAGGERALASLLADVRRHQEQDHG